MRPAVLLSISLSGFLFATATHVGAQEKQKIIAADAIQWGDGPPNLPAGAKLAVLSGDPGKRGLYVVRAKMSDGYAVPAHWHRKAEYVTVLSGTMNIGMGDKLDKSKGEAIKAGGFFAAEPRMRHYAWVTGETVIEISGMGPFDIQYVDKNDDPMKGMKAKKGAQ